MLAKPLKTSAARWAAVAARDAGADGSFVYAVATTGVYCRPSCPARRPNRANVTFHATPALAEAAGFRACRRCRPDSAAKNDAHAALIAAACRTIETAEEAPSLATLAEAAGMSPWHFHRVFRALTGVTPKSYGEAVRRARMRETLAGGGSVTSAIYAAGFASSSRFYAQGESALGMTASRFRDGGGDSDIRFAIGECSLGAVLVAATGKGVCAVLLGDDPAALLADLEARFPKARLIGADAAFEATVARCVGLIEHPDRAADAGLPLDVRGTAFQHRVWAALKDIPAGTTLSYAELARRIGQPSATRAVARACGANPVAVAIPCHRVVRNDGGLSGYRWGIERKRRLLQREGIS